MKKNQIPNSMNNHTSKNRHNARYRKVVLFTFSALLLIGSGLHAISPENKKATNEQYTSQNSGLVSNTVRKIYTDPYNVKWFGTDLGISRFNGTTWTTIDTSNHLRNNEVNDIAYEKTRYGDEVWVATHGGLSVIAFDIDGVTSATTYYAGGPESEITSDTVTAVGVDKNHTRWAATPKGINTFGSGGWDVTHTFINHDYEVTNLNGLKVNAIESYDNDSSVYMATSGAGVVRMSYDEIDGFTGASAMSSAWSGFWSDTIHSVAIFDTIQWYGTSQGAFKHFGPTTKLYWDYAITPSDGIIHQVVKNIEKDNDGNVWIGTEKGLYIMTQSSNVSVNLSSAATQINWTAGKGFVKALPNIAINDIQKDVNGTIWIATNSGVESFTAVPSATENDTKRVVFVAESGNPLFIPSNGDTYFGNAEFGKGKAIGNWYCVYNGNGTTVNVTGLKSYTNYQAVVFDYNREAGNEVYCVAEGANNPSTFTTSFVGNNQFSTGGVRAYPMPFNDYLVLHFDEKSDKTYVATIANLDGKQFKKVTFDKNNRRIDTSALAKGVYLLKVTDGEKVNVIKIVK